MYSLDQYSILTAAGIASIIVAISALFRIGHRPANLPPGPPTLPFLGNIHRLPARDPQFQYQKWAQQYGPIFSLILGTRTVIVLSSDLVVKDLLDKRSAIYSDRPDAYIGQTIGSGGNRMGLLRYGPVWRMFRKMVHALLNVRISRSYVPYQMLENKQMMSQILEQPHGFLKHLRRYSTSLTTSIVFGWRVPTYEDPKLIQLFKGFEEFAALNSVGTSALMDFFPILRWTPDILSPTKRLARKLFKVEHDLYVGHWLDTKAAIRNKTARPCFCVNMAKFQKEEGFDDSQAGYVSGTLLEAGADTTSNTLYGFLQAMLVFPEVQAKAQSEIDRIVGTSRLPTIDDEKDLPYTRAIVKESLRWMPTAMLGAFPHATTQDNYYNGYKIPKGAWVVLNTYGIHMDPARYPSPRTFDPDRYVSDFLSSNDSAVSPDAAKRDHFVFGAGRRICQGMNVADTSLFLGIARLLWGFNIRPMKDVEGNDIIPNTNQYTQGLVCMPVEYPADIRPRSDKRAEMIRKEWREAESLLDEATKQWREVPEGMPFSVA